MTQNLIINQKKIGIIIIMISMVLLFSVYSLIQTIINLRLELHESCPLPPEECPYKSSIPIESVASFILIIILAIFGLLLILMSKQLETRGVQKKMKLKRIKRNLEDDEKKIYDTILASEGVIFQSELIEKAGFSKVKVTRLLDKLEAKGIVERRRRGMSNIVILKGQ